MATVLPSLNLTFGPLHYQLLAHDGWGQATLARLRENLECVTFHAAPEPHSPSVGVPAER